MIIWHIITVACMINHPKDCWSTEWPRAYQTNAECLDIISHPLAHPNDGPVKLQGSKWVLQMCKGTVQ